MRRAGAQASQSGSPQNEHAPQASSTPWPGTSHAAPQLLTSLVVSQLLRAPGCSHRQASPGTLIAERSGGQRTASTPAGPCMGPALVPRPRWAVEAAGLRMASPSRGSARDGWRPWGLASSPASPTPAQQTALPGEPLGGRGSGSHGADPPSQTRRAECGPLCALPSGSGSLPGRAASRGRRRGRTDTDTLTHAHSHAHSHTRVHTLTLAHTHSHMHTLTRSHTRRPQTRRRPHSQGPPKSPHTS